MRIINTKINPEHANIDVFDIVTSPYMDINGQRKIGLFLVVYMEEKDPNDYNNRNVTGLKLTSRDLYANMYRTLVSREVIPELQSDSYVYANKLSTLLASNCRFVAKLPCYLCEEVKDKLKVYLSQVTDQTYASLLLKLKGGK